MSLQSNYKIKKIAKSYILYDVSVIEEPTLQLFDRDYHTNLQASQNNFSARKIGIGRAAVCYFTLNQHALVLKHYFRGGLVASLLKDRYPGLNIENSRAFKECRLLIEMYKLGLPVPQAVAAHVKKGIFFYQADLITRELEQAETLADVLSNVSISNQQWQKIGRCLKLFHHNNVYHADLNARNILLAGSIAATGDIYLIDFDNSGFRADKKSWKMQNMARLKRSLLKFKRIEMEFYFDDENWENLLLGYR